jgi:hypothetical protein
MRQDASMLDLIAQACAAQATCIKPEIKQF